MRMKRLKQLWAFDRKIGCEVQGRIAGLDEAGRGPLAGPVVASAVMWAGRPKLNDLDDSKKLSAKIRELLFWQICRCALVGIGVADEDEIDRLNIYQATRLAMSRAVLALTRTPDFLLIDGTMKLDLPLLQKPVVGGDRRSASIAAASIIAKVYRDAWMTHLDQLYPHYRFAVHKGYGTSNHLQILKACGPSPVHRRSFAPVRQMTQAEAVLL